MQKYLQKQTKNEELYNYYKILARMEWVFSDGFEQK